MDEISDLDSALIAANVNAEVVREQQQELRRLETRVALLEYRIKEAARLLDSGCTHLARRELDV